MENLYVKDVSVIYPGKTAGERVHALNNINLTINSGDFVVALGELGFAVNEQTSSLAFVAQVSDHLRRAVARYPESGPFAELAGLALTRALNETVAAATPSLFGSSIRDLQAAVRAYATRSTYALQSA